MVKSIEYINIDEQEVHEGEWGGETAIYLVSNVHIDKRTFGLSRNLIC